MESFLTTGLSIISSLLVVGISWGKFSTRLDVLEKSLINAVTKQELLAASIVSLQIEIAKLTGEIKTLETYMRSHNLVIKTQKP